MPDSNLYISSLLLGLSNQDFLLFLMDPIPDLSCDHKKKQKMKNLFSPESIIIAKTYLYMRGWYKRSFHLQNVTNNN
jgi:hypothetical protein